MKMVKSLLLGSAAGMLAVAGAQAADLPVKAKPVLYVKICSLYGDGFYYIPGTDTCIRFAGYVRADYNWNGRTPAVVGAAGAQDRNNNSYTTRHRANLTTDARTQTGYGTVRAYTSLNAEVAEGSATLGTHRAFIQFAGFTFGRTSSFVDHEGSLGDGGMRSLYTGLVDSTTGAAGINQIAYTWEVGNGITLNVGADEPRSGSVFNASFPVVIAGSGATTTGYIVNGTDPISSRAGTASPDPWISLRVNQAWGSASLAVIGHNNRALNYGTNTGAPGYVAAAGCTNGSNPFAVSGNDQCTHPGDKWGGAVLGGVEIKLPNLSPGSRVGFYGTYGVGASRIARNSQTGPALFASNAPNGEVAFGALTDTVFVNGSAQELTTAWAVGGGFEYFWTKEFSSTIYGGYTRTEYNNTVIANRWFCGGANGYVLPSGTAGTANGIIGTTGACDPGYSLWQVGTHHDWWPLGNSGLRLAVDVLYTQVDTAFAGQTITLSRGASTNVSENRPTGTYTAKDLGIVSVMFRAQRNWGSN